MSEENEPIPLEYESKRRPDPQEGRASPGNQPPPNPPAILAGMLAFFNVLWLAIAVLIAMSGTSDAYWLPLPGVLISSALAIGLAKRGRRDGVRAAAIVANGVCFGLAAVAIALLLALHT